jgi:hypothetical protein
MSEKFGLTLPRAQRLHVMAHPRLPANLYLWLFSWERYIMYHTILTMYYYY